MTTAHREAQLKQVAALDEVVTLSRLYDRDEVKVDTGTLARVLGLLAELLVGERTVAEVLAPVRSLLNPQPQPCICADNKFPGFIDDEGWEPQFRGDQRSLTGYGYLDCPYCDDQLHNPGWRTEEPSLDDPRAALDAGRVDQGPAADAGEGSGRGGAG